MKRVLSLRLAQFLPLWSLALSLKKSLQDKTTSMCSKDIRTLRFKSFFPRRAVKRTFNPPPLCTAVSRETNPAHHSAVFKKTPQNNKPLYEPKERYSNHGSIFASESMSLKKTLERAKRFELSTSTLGRWRSTV